MAVVTGAEAGLAAVAEGASLVQLRTGPVALLEREAERLLRAASVPVVISSRIDVVLATGAQGVNLPERDLPVAEARRLLGKDRLVGRSVHSPGAARVAEAGGADYVIFGPVFETPSHPGRAGAGLEALRQVVAAVGIPVLAIGGVDAERRERCLEAGAAGYAAIRLFLGGGG